MPDGNDEIPEGEIVELSAFKDGSRVDLTTAGNSHALNDIQTETQNVVANTNSFSLNPNKNCIHLGDTFRPPTVNNWGYIEIDTRKPPKEVEAFIKKYIEEAKWLRSTREAEIVSLQEELNAITDGSPFNISIRSNDINSIKLLPPPHDLYQVLRDLAHSLADDPPILDEKTQWYIGLGTSYSHRKTGDRMNLSLDAKESFLSHRRYIERLCGKPLMEKVWDHEAKGKPTPVPRTTGGVLSFRGKKSEGTEE